MVEVVDLKWGSPLLYSVSLPIVLFIPQASNASMSLFSVAATPLVSSHISKLYKACSLNLTYLVSTLGMIPPMPISRASLFQWCPSFWDTGSKIGINSEKQVENNALKLCKNLTCAHTKYLKQNGSHQF